MRVDRRDFLWIGGASALTTVLGCERGGTRSDNQSAGSPAESGVQPRATTTPSRLSMDITGLVLLERQQSAVNVHLVKGEAIGRGPHLPQMRIRADAIDQTATPVASASQVVKEGNDTFWVFDLTGVNVTMPSSPSGQSDLTRNETEIGSAEKPENEEGWRSLAWVPDLRTLSGASKIVDKAAVVSSIALSHGHLESGKPTGSGPFAVWRFKNPANQQLQQRALTDRVVYSCPTAEKTFLTIGNRQIVFRPNASVSVELTNLPPGRSRAPCPAPCRPNLNHFVAFFGLVDAQFTPTAELASFNPPPQADIQPDYCPPGQI